MSSVLDATRRFFSLFLKERFDADAFTASDVWPLTPSLFAFAEADRPLPPECLAQLSAAAIAMNLPIGARTELVVAMLEREFGPCPFGPERLEGLANYLRRQRNGSFSTVAPRRGPSLSGE